MKQSTQSLKLAEEERNEKLAALTRVRGRLLDLQAADESLDDLQEQIEAAQAEFEAAQDRVLALARSVYADATAQASIMRPDDVRAQQREEWTCAAEGWIADREWIVEPSPVTQLLIDVAGIAEGHTVLDMACGGGDPALPIARVVGERGRVLGLDITPAMIEGARALADELGVRNVEFRTIDDEFTPYVEAGVFDAITCRYGLMYMPDPAAAVRVWRAALRPGGRIAVCTWSSLPLIGFVLDIVARHAAVPEVDPAAPGVFALSTPAALAGVLHTGGYNAVTVVSLETAALEELPPEEWWDVMARSAGPLVSVLASLPESTRAAVRADGVRALRERHPSGIVAEYGETLAAVGFRRG